MGRRGGKTKKKVGKDNSSPLTGKIPQECDISQIYLHGGGMTNLMTKIENEWALFEEEH